MEEKVRLQKIIAAYTPFLYAQIDLSKTIKNRYIAVEFKDSFCHDIVTAWPQIDSTVLYNDMFGTLKTGNDILELIVKKDE